MNVTRELCLDAQAYRCRRSACLVAWCRPIDTLDRAEIISEASSTYRHVAAESGVKGRYFPGR
jgi:hypothetical protein